MKQELTSQQIDELFAFCSRHYVHYYDVQLELVDHLANAIEEKMVADKNISFESALDEVHKSFGYKGFAGVVEAKERVVGKQYRKIRWDLYRSYFTWPRATFTAFLLGCFWFIKFIIPQQSLLLIIYGAACLICLTKLLVFVKTKRLFKQQNKLLLMTADRYQGTFICFLALQVPVQVENFLHATSIAFNDVMFFSCSFILVLMIIGTLSYYYFCIRLLSMAKYQYPQAFAS